MALDALAARAVHLARAFERAVHDPGPWTITLDDGPTTPAVRVLGEAGVEFTARFQATCRTVPGAAVGQLFCSGQLVSVRELAVPDGVDFQVTWEMGDAAAVGA